MVKKFNSEIELSVVVPAYNEQEVITLILKRIVSTCVKLVGGRSTFEILVIDDGSSDETVDKVLAFSQKESRVKLVSLATNSGHMAAISAGLDICRGNWVVTMDADGQDPPEKIIEMLEAVKKERADICYAIRRERKIDPLRYKIFSPAFYFVLNKLTYGDAKIQAADFRLMSRAVVEVIKHLPERNRVYRVMVPDLKFKATEITYTRAPRIAGQSKYNFWKLAHLGIRSILATTGASVRLLSLMSLVTTFSMLILAFWLLYQKARVDLPPGWTFLSALLALTLLFQSLSAAVVSEVLIQINSTLRQRPLYQIKKKYE